MVFLTGSMGHAQELELSAGLTYKSLLGKQRELYAPVFGFEIGAARQEQAPFSADMIAWGANVGVSGCIARIRKVLVNRNKLWKPKPLFGTTIITMIISPFFMEPRQGFPLPHSKATSQ